MIHLSGPNNSTTFTNCCGVAISEESLCPRCKQEIMPASSSARFAQAMNSPYRGDDIRDSREDD